MIWYLIACGTVGGMANGAFCTTTQVPSSAVCHALIAAQLRLLTEKFPYDDFEPVYRCVSVRA